MENKKEVVTKSKRILNGLKCKQDRISVGKLALELQSQYKTNDTASLSDIGENSTRSFMDEVWIAVDRGKKEYTCSFYVVVLHRKEKLLPNVIRNQFFFRLSCPTPSYLQTVFKYNQKDDELEYLWSLPTKQRCTDMYMNKEFVPIEEYQLLSYVIDFMDGKLDRFAQTLNNESKPEVVIDPLG